jgi:hypothetical protein
MSFRGKPHSPVWPWIARYVLRQWNESQPAHPQALCVQAAFVGERRHNGNRFVRLMVEYDAVKDRGVDISQPLSPLAR